jgi:hypothetical protein
MRPAIQAASGELGLFWPLHKDAHGQGFATEAATARHGG